MKTLHKINTITLNTLGLLAMLFAVSYLTYGAVWLVIIAPIDPFTILQIAGALAFAAYRLRIFLKQETPHESASPEIQEMETMVGPNLAGVHGSHDPMLRSH